MIYLKADTATHVLIGPAVDPSDGVTPVTTLSLASADEAEVIKYNGATALTASAITNAVSAITGADGYYTLSLTATELNTEGFLSIVINDDSLILPIRHDFMVVNANVYDSLFAAATTDYLQTDVTQLGGTTQSATDLKDFADAGYDPATNLTQADMARISGSAAAADNLELSTLAIESGACESTPTTTVIQTDLASTVNDRYARRVLYMTSGSAIGQADVIQSYTGSTGTVTLKNGLATAPSATDTFIIL